MEQADTVGKVYRKSLLYLVSRSFEEETAPPPPAEPALAEDLERRRLEVEVLGRARHLPRPRGEIRRPLELTRPIAEHVKSLELAARLCSAPGLDDILARVHDQLATICGELGESERVRRHREAFAAVRARLDDELRRVARAAPHRTRR